MVKSNARYQTNFIESNYMMLDITTFDRAHFTIIWMSRPLS